jgi:putative Holliday junction resolvase
VATFSRILGVDYGARRIGIAVTDPLRIIAKGVVVLENGPTLIAELRRLVEEYEVTEIVVGMPYTLKGEVGPKAQEVERFIARLEGELHLQVTRFDERFSSRTARETMIAMGVGKKKRRIKGNIDMMAAALILQEYLESIQP